MSVYTVFVDNSSPSPEPISNWVVHNVYAKREEAVAEVKRLEAIPFGDAVYMDDFEVIGFK